eukprot:1326036-Lingulodinium_polyedra.AAC.1
MPPAAVPPAVGQAGVSAPQATLQAPAGEGGASAPDGGASAPEAGPQSVAAIAAASTEPWPARQP